MLCLGERRVLQSYQAWKEAAGLLSLIHLQRQEVASGPGAMRGGMDNLNDGTNVWTRRGADERLAETKHNSLVGHRIDRELGFIVPWV